jgi:hypothetical protein
VSGLLIAEATVDHAAGGRPVYWLPDRDRAAEIVAELAPPETW